MQAAVAVLFLAAPVVAGLSLSLEGFVVFLLMAALIAGLSSGENEESEASEGTSSRQSPSNHRGAVPYKVEVRFGRIEPAGVSAPFRRQEKAHDGRMMQCWVGGGYPHGS